MSARIQLPESAKRGEIVDVRILIQHAMETGYRFDDRGTPIPRNVINSIVCSFNGNEILRAETSSGISANPYFQFSMVAEASGELVLTWIDDEGVRGTERQSLIVRE
jgi:sulfur-oxidizing protein SoxZ